MSVSEQTIRHHRLRPDEVKILEALLLLLGDGPFEVTGASDVSVQVSREVLLAASDELYSRRSRS